MKKRLGFRALVPFLVAGMALTLAPASMAAETSRGEAFLRGNRLYESGDFRGAIQAYQEILDGGRTAAELEYNLGNAHLKAGDVGPAVLHYRRAVGLRPTYESALQNLSYARTLTQDVKEAQPKSNRLGWVGKFRLGPGLASALLWMATAGFLVVAGVRIVRRRIPGWATVTQWGLAAFALLCAGALLFEWSQLEGRQDAVVMAKEAQVRAGPGADQTLSFRLHEGTEVEVLRSVTGWYEVKVSSELRGWIAADAVEVI
jgi:tetratricopeptide (TPR) repeat protein